MYVDGAFGGLARFNGIVNYLQEKFLENYCGRFLDIGV
jgi:hypothetical protein